MKDFGDRPKYNARDIAKFSIGLRLGNDLCRKVLLETQGSQEDSALKTRVQDEGLTLARAVALSTSSYVRVQRRSYDKIGGALEKQDPKFANALKENHQGEAFFSGVIQIATTPAEERTAMLSAFPEIPFNSVNTARDAVTQATDFLEGLATTEKLSTWFDTDPSGFTLVKDLLEVGQTNRGRAMHGIPEQSFVLEGFRGVAEWYKAVYIRGYRAGLGPAPRLVP